MAEDDFDFATYAAELADKSGYAWGLKGIPGKDKRHEETAVAEIVLQHLGAKGEIESSEAPDVRVRLDSGRRIGIEVTELVDGKMRQLHAARRGAERKKGLSPNDAFEAEKAAFRMAAKAAETARANGNDWRQVFWTIYRDNHPTRDHISSYAFANWDSASVARKLDERIKDKDSKQTLRDNAAQYDEIWLAIFTDEIMIDAEMVTQAGAKRAYRGTLVRRVFVILGYKPSIGRYPVVEISAS